MIGLSSPLVDTSGVVLLKEDIGKTRLDEAPARLSISKTLDGGSAFEHRGVSDSDRVFTIVIPEITEEEYTVIKRLHRNYTSLVVACREGVFLGVMAQPTISSAKATLKINIKEKLNS